MNVIQKVKQKVMLPFRKKATAQQVHDDFFSASDQLLEEVNNLIQNGEPKPANYDSLKNHGFHNHPDVVKYDEAISKQRDQARFNEIVKYYRQRYPLHKFITQAKAHELCDKYGLLMGSPGNYIEKIPAKNFKEIENFKVDEEDISIGFAGSVMDQLDRAASVLRSLWKVQHRAGYMPPEDRDLADAYRTYIDRGTGKRNKRNSSRITGATSMVICAPQDHFNIEDQKIVGHMIVDEDPIVLQPVKEGFLIITAWGPEASDPNVVNEKMN